MHVFSEGLCMLMFRESTYDRYLKKNWGFAFDSNYKNSLLKIKPTDNRAYQTLNKPLFGIGILQNHTR